MQKNIPHRRQLFVAKKLGFCNGVKQALETVENVLQQTPDGQKIFIYNEIVHNSFIVNSLKNRGVQFCRHLDEVPDRATVIWSAHGVSPQIVAEAIKRNLHAVDATCPLVRRLHNLAENYTKNGHAVIFIGHENHPETLGVLGCGDIYCVSKAEDCLALPEFALEQKITVLTQTTWSSSEVEALLAILKKRFPTLELVSGICYATSQRQQAVHDLIRDHAIERLLVIGSPTSSNSKRLCQVSEQAGVKAILLDDPQELYKMDFSGVKNLGLTAGASAPEILLKNTLDILQTHHHFNLFEDENE